MSDPRPRPRLVRRVTALLAALSVGLIGAGAVSPPAHAAKSTGCTGGGFTALGKGAGFTGSVAAPAGRFRVQGRFQQFDVDPVDFAVYDQAFTGPSPVPPTPPIRPAAGSHRSTPAGCPITAGSA